MDLPFSTICAFCGSSCSPDPAFAEAAQRMGELIAEQGLTLIYGAGRVGMMGELAAGALNRQGKVIGVTHEYEAKHAGHMEGLLRLEVMPTLQQRKARLAELAEAFLVLPGGYGTMDEFFEVLTWAQIGLINKPIGLLNVKGYFDGLVSWVERAAEENFINREHVSLFVVDREPENLLTKLGKFRFPGELRDWFKKD